jgi:predicted ribosome quality control (RQC) complex YloA/Tae2 family protein
LAKLERGGVKYLRYVTSDGIAIIVGQSDRSNDELVRHYGSSRHLWLHVRDYPGSHVLLLTNGREVPQRSLEEAAVIAGYYSKGRGETELEISYTPVKLLRRPKGGKPGQVLLVSEKVIRVNPMRFEALRESLRVSSTSP